MDTTLTILAITVFLYILACIHQWRRLNRDDEGREEHPRRTGTPR